MKKKGKSAKIIALLAVILLAVAVCFFLRKPDTGGEDISQETIEVDLEEELEPLDEEEMEAMQIGISGDDEMEPDVLDADASMDENGTYSSKEDVAAYIYEYGHLPSNYITKKEAQELGWDSKEGNLDEVAPGKCIGGDSYGNYDKLLPEEEGRTYQECDVNYEGGFRGSERIVYSNDGMVFYTDDHYATFSRLY